MASWLKATQRRVKETILQSVGAHDKTSDQEFDERCAKFTSFYRDLTKVHMSMQLWLDSIDLLCGSWVGIGESLFKFCNTSDNDTSSSLSDIVKGFSSIGNDVNLILRGIVKSIFIDRCLKPIESILAIVPIINTKIQERKNLLLDVAFYNSKKQSEKSSGKDDNHPNVIKIINKLNESERLLKNLTDDIDSCMEQLCSARSFMLGPEIAALISCMETFPLIISQKVNQMTPLIPQTASTKCLLLASIETAEMNMKSNILIETLRSNSSSFPIEPVLRRTGATGGTTGGYGHAGYLEGLMSTVDLLLKSNEPSSRNSGNLDTNEGTRDSMNISRDSQSLRISSSSTSSASVSQAGSSDPSSSSQGRSTSPSPRAMTTTKRPVIKLGSDRPVSTKTTQQHFESSSNTTNSMTSTNESFSSSTSSSSTNTTATARPISMMKPTHPPPKPPNDSNNNTATDGDGNSTRRIPSKRLTGSALLLSGRPRDLLGESSLGSSNRNDNLLEEVIEEDEDYDRWKANNEIDDARSTLNVPQSIRVSQFSIQSGDISLDGLKKPTSPSSTSSLTLPTPPSSIPSTPSIVGSSGGGAGEEVQQPPSQIESTTTPSPQDSSSKDEYVVAIYKFDSDVEGDLTFKRDEVIQIVNKEDPGWWTGRIADRTGIFPSNYVKPLG